MRHTKYVLIAMVLIAISCGSAHASQMVTISTADNEYRGILNQTSSYVTEDTAPNGVAVGIEGGNEPELVSMWAFSLPAGLPQVTGATLMIPYGTFTPPTSFPFHPVTPTPYDTLNLLGGYESISKLFAGSASLPNGEEWPGSIYPGFGSISIYPGGDPTSYVTIPLTPLAVQWINAAIPGMNPLGNFGTGGTGWIPIIGMASYGNNLALVSSSPALLQLTVAPEPAAWVLGLAGAVLAILGRRWAGRR